MKHSNYDILVLKEYETQKDGKPIKHKTWNRVGRAWNSQSDRSLSFELFLMPGHQYVIMLRDKTHQEPAETLENFDNIPF